MPVAHSKSTNEIHRHKAHVYIVSLSTKIAYASYVDNSKFLLHAAYEELNLIQIVTFIQPLQMMIKH